LFEQELLSGFRVLTPVGSRQHLLHSRD